MCPRDRAFIISFAFGEMNNLQTRTFVVVVVVVGCRNCAANRSRLLVREKKTIGFFFSAQSRASEKMKKEKVIKDVRS